MYYVLVYMKKYHNSELVFYPSDQVIDQAEFERQYWTSSQFGHVSGKENIPPNMHVPRVLCFVVNARIDGDHYKDIGTERSRTGFIVYVNSAPVYWMSKRQTSCDS